MDYVLKHAIENAIYAAVEKLETEAAECLVCSKTRESFPGVIHLFQGDNGKIEVKVATTEDIKGEEWVELRPPGEYTKAVVCKRCAIKRKLIEDPNRCIPCEEEYRGLATCLKHNPPPAVAAPAPTPMPTPATVDPSF